MYLLSVSGLIEAGQEISGKPEFSEGKRCLRKPSKLCKTKATPLQDLDLVVQALAEAVGFVILLAFLDSRYRMVQEAICLIVCKILEPLMTQLLEP